MELRPFRSLRYSPRVIEERGLSSLIAPPAGRVRPELLPRLAGAAPENIIHITARYRDENDPQPAAGETYKRWLSEGVLLKERRPGLWIYRQSFEREGKTIVLPLLVGVVRVREASSDIELPPETVAAKTRAERLAFRWALKADFEPCLLLTRAPLASALATTRRPDFSAVDPEGMRHDALRINDYAQHVELQGLVKNAEVVLAQGHDLWEAARGFAQDPDAVKLSGAKFKLCAILDETFLTRSKNAPTVSSGLFGVSLEDPVY